MQKKIHFLFSVAALLMLVFFNGCNNNAFNFSQLDEIEGSGDWGFPLVNAEYTIGDILSMGGNLDNLHQGSDGTLGIRYEYTFDSIISASEYLGSYFNQEIGAEGSRTVSLGNLPPAQGNVQLLYRDTLTAHFPSDKILLESAVLESGRIVLQVNYNITQPTQIVVTCPQLTSASGQSFRVEAQSSGGSYSATLSLNNYTLTVPSGNEIDVIMEVSCSANMGAVSNDLSFTYSANFNNVVFSEIRGKFVSIDLPVDKEWDFDSQFLRDHISGNMILRNPQVSCEIMNSFPVRGSLVMENAVLTGGGNVASLLAYSPATIEIPANTQHFVPVNLPIASTLMISPDFTNFKLKGNAVVNPDGFSSPTLVFRKDQLISLRISVVLPLDVDVDEITFCDTIEFGGVSLPSETAFSNILLRLGITNGLPLNFQLQAYFYDSQTATVKDSLFSESQLVMSAVGGTPRMSELFATKENFQEVQRIFSCDNVILRARMFSDGSPISINVAQAIRFQMSARMNVDMNGLVNLGN